MSGHGGTRYCPITDSYAVSVVADLTVENFKLLLHFLQHKIPNKMFHFATCFGGGKRIEMLFNEIESKKYNFAILCECLSDGFSYCKVRQFNFPSYQMNVLSGSDITYTPSMGWHLKLDFGYNWNKFFKSMTQNKFDDNLIWLYSSLMHINENILGNITMLHLPDTGRFFPILPDFACKISDVLLKSLKNEQSELVLYTSAKTLLIESGNVDVEIVSESNSVTNIISLGAGNSKQYLKKISFKTSNNILVCFGLYQTIDSIESF